MWEVIDGSSERLRVPGGWIIRSKIVIEYFSTAAVTIHQVFVSDPAHEWELTK